MPKVCIFLWFALLLIFMLTGCATVTAPVSGFIFTSVQGPITATSASSYSKEGSSSCISILGLFAIGDASIDTAIRQAKISKIHHVDYESTSFLFIFSKYTVWVYGE